MIQTRLVMGMPVTVEIIDASATDKTFDGVYDFFHYVDNTFSPFKKDSEVSRMNRGELLADDLSYDMQRILMMAEQTREITDGFFDVYHNGVFNPSGVVKGWAIYEAAELLRAQGFENFYVDAGGDVQVAGTNKYGHPWRVGILNPFDLKHIVKTVSLDETGIATSGFYMRGQHIYNPKDDTDSLNFVMSMTVIGPNVYEADRFATAAFAMGQEGIMFIESLPDFEGYMIDRNGMATMTTGFPEYVAM